MVNVVVQWDMLVPNGANGWNCAQWGWLSSAQWGGKIESNGTRRKPPNKMESRRWEFPKSGVGNCPKSQKRLKWSDFSNEVV